MSFQMSGSFGDTHIYGPEGINFCTRGKVVTSRWPDPATSKASRLDGWPRSAHHQCGVSPRRYLMNVHRRPAALALRGVGVLLLLLLVLPSAARAGGPTKTVIGEKEPVAVSAGPFRPMRKLEARIDTGAYYSSIDAVLARRLGINPSKARKIEIRSALGTTKRPLVDVQFVLAGHTVETRATVANRVNLTNKVLIGRRDLKGFLIDVGRTRLAPTGPATVAPTARTVLADLPLAAFLAVALRLLIGLRTFGLFAPVLLAIAFVNSGLRSGLLVIGVMLALGLLVSPLLRPLRLPRVSRLAVLVAIVSATLLLTDHLVASPGAGRSWATAFPVVVTSVMLERFWELWEGEGATIALHTALSSVVFAVGASLVMTAQPVLWLTYREPFAVVVLGALLSLGDGMYRGLRLNELVRFRSVAAAAGRS